MQNQKIIFASALPIYMVAIR